MRLLCLMFLLCHTTNVAAHEWYDSWCCDEKDCKPVPSSSVTRDSEGWHYLPYGTTIPHGSYGIKPSLDGGYHQCETPARTTRCLYVPLKDGV